MLSTTIAPLALAGKDVVKVTIEAEPLLAVLVVKA
jgi:hypothetical protein